MSKVNLGAEIGAKFSVGKRTSKLSSFKFFIQENNFNHTAFKINIYSIDKKNLPKERLNKKDIIRSVENAQTGWIDVRLSEYQINVNQDVVVSIEWVEASEIGDTLSLPIFAPTPFQAMYYYKLSAQAAWRKYGLISPAMLLEYKQHQ